MEPQYTEPTTVNIAPPQRLENLWGLFPTMSTVPTHVPRNLYEQVVNYKSGATKRLYIYDITNNAWSYTALT
jgi:hypothetical protein